MKRAIIIVLDSVGIGELPDAADFGDVGSNTLVNIKKVRPQTSLPNLCALGLGDIQGKDISLLGEVGNRHKNTRQLCRIRYGHHSGFRRGAHENRLPHRLYLCGQRVPDCGT